MKAYHPGEILRPSGHRYRVEKAIAQGAMAHSYRAIHENSGSAVLLKIYADPVPDPRFTPWFKDYHQIQEDIRKRLAAIPDQALGIRHHFIHEKAYHQVIEWAQGRSLEDLFTAELQKSKTMEKPLLLSKVMLFSLARVHQQGIIH
ncbi:MAG: hypothetical protein KDM64_15045, partial [Verrucomicrobiae bacterium]|nr:hypothetical protein [Verrucomicrobiae bacterium]